MRRPVLALLAAAVLAAGCTGGGASPSAEAEGPVPGGLLDVVTKAGELRVSTDPQYPPQSELKSDGTFQGFDIDVATEIAKRMGLEVKFETPSWDTITAGSWGGRWDLSVGSMTITSAREAVVAFSEPYYYTPAQMAVPAASTISSVAELAGKRVCVGAATTYQQWIEGTLDFGTKTPDAAPAGITIVSLPTDRNCAESWQAGRNDFEAWLTSSTTVQGAIDEGMSVKAIGDPVFAEPLAVAFDKSGPDPSDMVTRVNAILEEMHADGTLKTLSEKWFEIDLTTPTGE